MNEDKFYIVRSYTPFEKWVKDGCWDVDENGDPLKNGYHEDYPSLKDALDEQQQLNGQVLTFSMEAPYKLLECFPQNP